jgi:pimeloyl-ACP methyl ester carboxylesterase
MSAGAALVEDRTAVELAGLTLPALLTVPPEPRGIVAFAHGSGSSRLSPRNRLVSSCLNRGGFATLLFDLLEPEEALDRRNVFDVELLAGRLAGAARWILTRTDLRGLPLGFFGASTGAAAALWAAADLGNTVSAVVSRGGRPDLAADRLPEVRCPALLIVGGADQVVVELNRSVLSLFGGEAELRIVAGATHLFEESGALEQVAELAAGWFARYFGADS